ncbi:Helix-turn-helix domain-containing protein [Streptomyces sp. yr375]|uniref:ArsR/SmtB family transcription factor n=1 Tax=Streptomyces sp. yr375 TaxID=1761906 RepID=UPI0008C9206E|nr:helix-turn-helix domain-containing protein [Streptomyces sp. yr375]SER95974.1 Helix-turn-helix domain-containing protein [Streptomyces sp. yr375]
MSQEPGEHEEFHEARRSSAPSVELGDLAALKALAQPRRQRMLEHLTLHGPATSATLARALGLNTGSTSYHLRELARYGFVEETAEETAEAGCTEPSAHRERWWRAVPGDRRFPPRSRQSPELRHVMNELNHHAYAADLDLFERLQQDAGDGDPWADAFPYSRGTIRLTLPELREFFEEYIALLNRYKRPDSETPPDARTLLTRFLAFPAPAHGNHDPARTPHSPSPHSPSPHSPSPRTPRPRTPRARNGRETDPS